jgi:hypothetical protein
MKALIGSLMVGSAILFTAGCATEGARTPVVKTKAAIEDRERYALMGDRVQRSVDFSSTQLRTLEDGRLQVITNVRNRENRRIEVQISCVFKDENRTSTGDETPWQTLILTENAQEAVNFTSMNNRAKDFTIRVREAH